RSLEEHVAGEPVADHHVARAVEELVAFDVAGEIDRRALEKRPGRLDELVPLGLLLPDVEETDARPSELDDVLGVDRGHDGVLREMLRARLHVRADVADAKRPLAGADRHEDSGTAHERKRPKEHLRGGDARAGVPGAEESLRLARTDEVEGDANRRARLASKRLDRALPHADRLGSVDDAE